MLNCPDANNDLRFLVKKEIAQAVLDIGCYTGETIADFNTIANLPVYGFEPTPGSYNSAVIRHRNNNKVKIFQLALSNKNGFSTFHVNTNKQTNSLLDTSADGYGTWGSSLQHEENILVKTQMLDDWFTENMPPATKVIVKKWTSKVPNYQ